MSDREARSGRKAPPAALILNVDDHEPARYAKARILRRAGYEVVDADTGGRALELVQDRKPDLVLLDIRLPDIDGFEVCRRIRGSPDSATLPVLHTSASFVGYESRVQALEQGANGYLVEPCEPEVLVASVRALLRLRWAERALRESEERFRQFADATHEVLWIHDAEAGRYEYASRAFAELFGREPSALLADGSTWAAAVHPADRDAYGRHFESALAGESAWSEYRIVRPDGTVRWVSDRAFPIRSGRPPTRIAGIVQDVTQRREAEEERRVLLDSERAARLEAERAGRLKDQFLSTLSHELRTPLNAILGWIQLLRASERTPEEVEEGLEVLERNARAQMQLISDLLDVSRIVSGKVRIESAPIDLERVVEEALEGLRPAAQAKGVAVRTRAAPYEGTLFGDAERLSQVVWNLASNALKFTPPGGAIEVGIARREGSVELSVSDDGEGIAPELLPHLFERFRQGDSSINRRQGGLGLGLSIVRSLVELHGGRASAHSEGRGRGATFTVELPLDVHPEAATLGAAAVQPSPRSGGVRLDSVRVLLADDQADAREFVRRALVDRGADVLAVGSARDVLRQIPVFRPDVLVSDIGMPDVDGYELVRTIRAGSASPALPAVALTAYARGEDVDRVLAAGYQRHVAKPVFTDDLLEAIVSVLPAR